MHYTLVSDLHQHQVMDTQDRGLHYGDGLFETMLLNDGVIKYWSEHYERLSRSAVKLNIDCPVKSWFEKNLQPFIDLNQRLVIKIILTRGSGGRGLSLPDKMHSNVYLLKYLADKNDIIQPVKATISEITLSSNKNFSGLKHLNRLDYVLATQDLKKRTEFNEAILFDNNGYVIESLVNNIFFMKGSTLFTPNLKTSGVDGIMRQLILKKLKHDKKEVKIGFYSKHDLVTADECLLCNSVQGIRPVIQIDDKKFSFGNLTKNLQTIFHGHSGN